jgi:hypothetical protein
MEYISLIDLIGAVKDYANVSREWDFPNPS